MRSWFLSRSVWLLVGAMTVFSPLTASAVLIVQDGFNDGGRADGADPQDVAWYTSSTSSMVMTVVSDAGIGSGNALKAVNSSASSARTAMANFGPDQALVNIGDYIELAFDFRLELKPGAGDSPSGFRFGLFNNGGTLVTADATGGNFANALTDKGYFAALSTGVTATGTLYKDLGTSSGSTSFIGGSDLTSLKTDTAWSGISDSNKHTAKLRLTLVQFEDSLTPGTYYNGLAVRLVLDEGTAAERALADDDKALGTGTTTFNEIGFSSNVPAVNSIYLDNVTVTTGVPEPASLVLMVLGATGALLRRR